MNLILILIGVFAFSVYALVQMLWRRLRCRHPYAYSEEHGNQRSCRWCGKRWTVPCDHPKEKVRIKNMINCCHSRECYCTNCFTFWTEPWPGRKKCKH